MQNQNQNYPPPPNNGGGGLSQKTLIIIIIAIAVVGTGLVGFLYWWTNVRVDQIPERPIVTVTATATPSELITPTPTASTTVAPSEADLDHDRDGYTPNENDCNDNDAFVNPGASEVCADGIDNDCDREIDESCDVRESFDPAVFDYSPYYIYDDEEIQDYLVRDSDEDGEDEVMVVTYSRTGGVYHAFIIDWDAAFATYMLDWENTFEESFVYLMEKDWDGNGYLDFVIVHARDSGWGTGVSFDFYLDEYFIVESDLGL